MNFLQGSNVICLSDICDIVRCNIMDGRTNNLESFDTKVVCRRKQLNNLRMECIVCFI